MSKLHSESKNEKLKFTVRVKFLNLDRDFAPPAESPRNEVAESRLGAILASGGKKQRQAELASSRAVNAKPPRRALPAVTEELCLQSHGKLVNGQLEEHIKVCQVCANRVELQLAFIDCLETVVYQRLGTIQLAAIRGALLVSAPKLNFAICGELGEE